MLHAGHALGVHSLHLPSAMHLKHGKPACCMKAGHAVVRCTCSSSSLLVQVRQLIDQTQWDVRHGGLLGLKYLLAARADLGPQLLPEALPAALLGLKVSQCHAEDTTFARADLALSCYVSRALGSSTAGVLTVSGSHIECASEQTMGLMLCHHRLQTADCAEGTAAMHCV